MVLGDTGRDDAADLRRAVVALAARGRRGGQDRGPVFSAAAGDARGLLLFHLDARPVSGWATHSVLREAYENAGELVVIVQANQAHPQAFEATDEVGFFVGFP